MNLIKINDRIIIVDKIFSEFMVINPVVNNINKEFRFNKEEKIYLYSLDNILEFTLESFRYIGGSFHLNYKNMELLIEGVHFEGFQYHKDIFTEEDFQYVKNLKTINKFNL